MAGLVRKRGRDGGESAIVNGSSTVKRRSNSGGTVGAAQTTYERRRKAMEADEVDSDIDSADEAKRDGTVLDNTKVGGADGDSEDESSEEDVNETAEEKRLRLARAYLKNVGLDPDAAGSDGEGDEDEAIERLQDEARRASGRRVTEIAAFLKKTSAATGLPVSRSVEAHKLSPTCVAITSDESRAVSGGKDAVVFAWDAETGVQLSRLAPEIFDRRWRKDPSSAPGHVGHVLSVAVADGQGGNIVASGGVDGLVRVWDLRSGKQVEALRGHRGEINSLAFRSGTMQLFSASTDRTVKIWDVGDMAYVETLFGHGAGVCGVDSFAKERAISCGRDGTMRLYKVLDGSQLVFRRSLTATLDAVSMVNEQRFVSGGDDGTVALWHVNKKRPVALVANAHGSGTGCNTWISSVVAGRNTDLAVSGGGDGYVRLWHCENRPPALTPVSTVKTGPGFVNGLALGSRCRLLVAAVGQEPRLGRWEKRADAKNGLRFIAIPSE